MHGREHIQTLPKPDQWTGGTRCARWAGSIRCPGNSTGLNKQTCNEPFSEEQSGTPDCSSSSAHHHAFLAQNVLSKDFTVTRSGPFTIKQVAVCRTCYEVYRRLDKLREKSDRGEGKTRKSSAPLSPLPLPAPSKGRQEVLASIDATAASGKRAAAAEAGAVALRAEVAEMLKDVDARTGKLGSEAGIIWRRRLRCVQLRFNFFAGIEFRPTICCRVVVVVAAEVPTFCDGTITRKPFIQYCRVRASRALCFPFEPAQLSSLLMALLTVPSLKATAFLTVPSLKATLP